MKMNYSPNWDLATIPDEPFYSEAGRRRGARAHPKQKKLAPCRHCGQMAGAFERRGACPHCHEWIPEGKRRIKRLVEFG